MKHSSQFVSALYVDGSVRISISTAFETSYLNTISQIALHGSV